MSAKNYDKYQRFRSKTIGFRVSPEENKQINMLVAVSGMTKQEYIVSKLMDNSIIVHGNCRLHRIVSDKFRELLNELKRMEKSQQIGEEVVENMNLLLRIISSVYNE